MNSVARVGFASVVALGIALNAGAAPRKPAPKPSAPKKVMLDLNTPCDFSGKAVPARFGGHDIEQLHRRVSTLPKKDEFETHAQFDSRVGDAVNGLGAAVEAQALCFTTDVKDARFDAERQILWVPMFIDYGYINTGDIKWFRSLRVLGAAKNRRETSYQASNAFGVPTTVHKTTRTTINAVFDFEGTRRRILEAGGEEIEGFVALPVPMPGEQARTLKGKVALAVQYRLVPPFAAVAHDREMPKIDYPFEKDETVEMVVGEITQVAAFNVETGEVLARFPLVQ